MSKIFLLPVMLFVSFCVYAQNIKDLGVETSYVEYPKIAVENIDYNNLIVEFSHGEIILGDKSVVKSANLCKPKGGSIKDAKALETFYYKIKYTSPEGIVKISNSNGDLLYVNITENRSKSVDEFGKNECYFMEAILKSAYGKMKVKNDSMLKEDVYKSMYARAQNFVNQSISFHYYPEKFKVHYVKSTKEFDYSDLKQAAQLASDGYLLLNNNFNNQIGKDKLNKAIEIWKLNVANVDVKNRKAKINRRIAGRLYKNIALAYSYLINYEVAIENIQLALKLYPNISNNNTVSWERLRDRFYDQKMNFDINKDVEVVIKSENIPVVYRGNDYYQGFRNDYDQFVGAKNKNKIVEAKKSYDEGVASGIINPYEAQMVKSAAQGYILVLPSLTSNITSFEEMKLAMKKLDEFPLEICELTQLNQLTLKNNNISLIPSEIKNLKNLRHLNLSKNKVSKLPSELGELKELKTLNVKGNPLSEIEIDKIQKLLPNCNIKF